VRERGLKLNIRGANNLFLAKFFFAGSGATNKIFLLPGNVPDGIF